MDHLASKRFNRYSTYMLLANLKPHPTSIMLSLLIETWACLIAVCQANENKNGWNTVAYIQAEYYYIFIIDLRGTNLYQRGHSAQYSGFKLATSTLICAIYTWEFIFIATSHKHNCAFTITYVHFSNWACLLVIPCWWGLKRLKQLSMAFNNQAHNILW